MSHNVITVYEGLRTLCPGASIDTMCFRGRVTAVDDAGIRTAAAKARTADVNILVLGDNSQRYSAFGRTCGENCDRDNIALPGRQQELLEAVAASGRPTVLILMSGRALGVEWAAENPSVNAIVNVWEPGQMGGQAIAEILFGIVNPSGKLPVTIPRNAGQIQCVYNHKPSQYSRHFALAEQGPLFAFGYGLSYTHFSFNDITLTSEGEASPSVRPLREPLPSDDGPLPLQPRGAMTAGEASPSEGVATVTVTVTNDGPCDGAEVVQLYVRDEYGSVTRPVKELKAFKKVWLNAGESTSVSFNITPEMLACWSINNKWEVEPGEFTIFVGNSSRDEDLKGLPLRIMP